MVPAAFVAVERWPLTTSGKIDRAALPQPDLEPARADGATLVAPRTDLERLIADIWRQVLRTGGVGMHDNFFDLGGHSLLMAQVRSRLREQLNRDVPMIDLFRFPTVGALAGHLSGEGNGEADLAGVSARAESRRIGVQQLRQVRARRISPGPQ